MTSIIETFSRNLTNVAKKNLKDMNEEQCQVVSYGIHLLVSDSIKMVITLAAAYFLGILNYTIIAMVSFGLLRSFAGGVHAKTWTGCLVANSLMFYGVVYLSIYLPTSHRVPLISLVFALCLIVVSVYAPSDHKCKPVVSRKQRKHLKTLSLSILALMFVTSIICTYQPISLIIAFSALAECISILPLTYKITGNSYGSV
ncbi:MAG: accessory gene regulator AgrB [Clostridia bacterium]|nr:accessory gene regulator AgrB [Clostridia bacterium]